MKNTLLFLFLSFAAVAQNPVGIGVLRIDYTEYSMLRLYENKGDEMQAKALLFTKDDNGWHLKNTEKQAEWLDPEYLADGEHWFAFRCLADEDGWYRLTINRQTGKSYWVKHDNVMTEFWTWENYFTYMYRIYASGEIKQAPDANAPAVAYDGEGCFKARSLKGDWLEIYTAEGSDCPELKSGWVLWHINGEPNISYAPR